MIVCHKCGKNTPNYKLYELVPTSSPLANILLCLECWEVLVNNINMSRDATIAAFLEKKPMGIDL